MASKDYHAVLEALTPLDPLNQTYLAKKYSDMPALYREACYQYANDLYAQKRPFEALTYYRLIPDYADVADKKLTRTVYRVIGKWTSEKGVSMEFRDDGTCLIDGREAYYNCPNMYAMDTGDRPDELSYTFNILNSSRNVLNLKHEKKNVIYRMTRAEEE